MIPAALSDKGLGWVLERASDAILIVDPDGNIAYANPAAERLFGYGCDELAMLPVERLIPERLREKHLAQRAAFAALPRERAMGTGLDLHARRKDGGEFPVDVSLSPLATDAGRYVLATVHDVTRRKQAEAALRGSEARMRAIVDTAVDAVITIDACGVIDAFNPAAERLFGYRAEEVVGQNVALLMPEPDRGAHDDYIRRYLNSGEKRIIGIGREVTAQRRDGTTFPAELAVSEFTLGERRLFTGMVRDISARKRAEARQMQLLHEIEATNEELKNFAYVVSHDLKAPLRGIGSLADWLTSDYADKLDAQGREYLALMKNRVTRMDALIDGVLEYSRVGRIRETRVAVDLNALVDQVIQLLAPPPGVAVIVDGPLPTVMAERTRLQQLFQNLIGNAIKHLDKPQGAIRVACTDAGEFWEFSVADNGPGIEPRHHERIFQLFQTLTPRDRKESTGVGLAIVKKIIELYGGRIWVDSAPGQGSTFFFTLPKTATGESHP